MPGPIKVTLRRESESNRASVDLKGPKEESETCWFDLPWLDETEWKAMFLSLELLEEDPTTWPQVEVRQKAQELGLFLQDRPSNDRFEIIGQALYNAVFGSEKIRRVLYSLLQARGEIPVIEFHIPDEGSILQSYPWELLHSGNRFLFEEGRALPVRHVDFDEPLPEVELAEALRVLYVAPRPDISSQGYAKLPVLEKSYLENLSRRYPTQFALESLPVKTLDALHKYLLDSENLIHIVHIDTHGGFGWLCQQYKMLNPPGTNQCYYCNGLRSSDQRDRGYLAFETTDGKVDWISGDDLVKRLHRRDIQVVILSACRSALVGGKSTFNSVAGALVRRHIPAVVAMQFSVETEQVKKCTEFFYEAIIKGQPLTEAMAEARIALPPDSWYRPVLYLRTDPSNYRGTVFQVAAPPRKLVLEWKRIHHECQELLKELRDILQDFEDYKRTNNRSLLDNASRAWARECDRRLKDIPDRWMLKYVRVPELDELRECIMNVEKMPLRLMQIRQVDPQFWKTYLQVESLYGILWRLLTIADGNISGLLQDLNEGSMVS